MPVELFNYESPSLELWQGRRDSLPLERFFQRVVLHDPRRDALPTDKNSVAVVGFCSDEGVHRNSGRIGAAEGPNALREQLAKLPCHSDCHLTDMGNIICANEDLEKAQQQFAQIIQYCHQSHLKTLAFGGGHEIAWAHFRGLSQTYPQLGIINFDAHFDLRPVVDNQSTSGTPFRQIADYCEAQQLPFDYACLGIQEQGNTSSLFAAAAKRNVSVLTAEQMHQSSFSQQTAFLDIFLARHSTIFLSICMDVFSECHAPGVSAPQAAGLTPWQVIPLLKYIVQTGKVVSIEIAELSPALDENHKTARLAAMIAAVVLELY